MSLHVHHHECGHVDEGAVRLIFWTSWCDCGWQGGQHWLHETSEAAAKASRDYRVHVEEALGAEAYYTTSVACRNCGSEHDQGVLIGTHITSSPCARCGTTMLNPRNDAWDESREFSKGWRF
jgi:hypothetical protein